MHILVATSETQGERPGDVSWTVDGELVRFPVEAGADSHGGRAFAGLASCRATTTAAVVDHPVLDRDQYRALLADALVRQGLVERGRPEDEGFVTELAARQCDAAAVLPAGTIVEIADGLLCLRQLADVD